MKRAFDRLFAPFLLWSISAFALPGAVGTHANSADVSNCSDAFLEKREGTRRTSDVHVAALHNAIDAYQQSLSSDPSSLTPPQRARLLADLGKTHLMLHQYSEALQSFSSAIEVLEQISEPSRKVQQQHAAALLNRALTLRHLGRIDEAVEEYKAGGRRFHSIGDGKGESRVLEDLGLMQYLMANYNQALVYYENALRVNDSEERKVEILDFRGRVYVRTNQAALAYTSLNKALALARKIDDWRLVAYTLNDLGALALNEKHGEAAERRHCEALQILQVHTPADSDGIAETLAYLADVQRESGRYDVAVLNYKQALSLQESSQDIIGRAQTLVSLARCEATLGDAEDALSYLANAITFYHEVHERLGESYTRFQIARLYAMQHRAAEAMEEVEKAISIREEIRSAIPGDHLRQSYFNSVVGMYRVAIDLLLESDHLAPSGQIHAFELVQRMRSRVLLEAWEAKRGDNHNDQDFCDGSLQLLRSAKIKQWKKLNGTLQLLIAEQPGSGAAAKISESIRELEIAMAGIDAQCNDREPRIGLLSDRTIATSEIQNDLLDEQSALLYFYLSGHDSYAWIITCSSVDLIRLPARAVIGKHVFESTQSIESSEKMGPKALRMLEHDLAPIFSHSNIRRWIIVPDGELGSFPFAVLTAVRGADIIKIPSPSALRILRATAVAPPRFTLLVFADPVFDARDSRMGPIIPVAARPRQFSYPRLPDTSIQAQRIGQFVSRKQRTTHTGFDANLATLRGIGDFKIIHFATHSDLDTNPDLSRIVLSQFERDGRSRAGFLFQKDIYGLKLHSDLVVLSSCRGAMGSQDAGEGLLSLSRAFLFAGSKSVLASLWGVADGQSTTEFMSAFYGHMLRDKNSPAAALARTQAEFRRHPNAQWRKPYYWAGFELYGDWQVQIKQ